VHGVTVACAGGAGMMWGPAVARVAADMALGNRSDVLDATQLGLGRFDDHGRSRLTADPIALPFPEIPRAFPEIPRAFPEMAPDQVPGRLTLS
jgi:sarcosine oxidase subunit beta